MRLGRNSPSGESVLTTNTNMFAVVNNTGLVAKDFRTRPEALAWCKQFDTPMKVINQNSKEYLKYERKGL